MMPEFEPKGSRGDVFNSLVDFVEKHKDYTLYSKKNVLELPLYFIRGRDFNECLEDFCSKYNQLVNDYPDIDKITQETVCTLTSKLKKTIDDYLNGKVASAYSQFKEAMEPIKDFLPIKSVEKRVFFRMRAEEGLKDKKDFYHLPFNMIHLSKNERFSIDGYPCLYLGYSKSVCKKEILSGTIATFMLDEKLDGILDLTLGQGDEKKDIPDINLVQIYPLIALCYIVPFYCTVYEKECRPDKSFFRVEYIIPQLLTLYLREESMAKGIIYYTVKDPNLNLQGKGEDDFKNIVLFTNRENNNSEKYDEELMDKFTISL